VVESPALATKDGAPTPGEAIRVNVKVTNVGDTAGQANLSVDALGLLAMSPVGARSPMLAPGQSAVVAVPGQANPQAGCGQPFTIDVRTPGAKGPSRAFSRSVLGLLPRQIESFDGASAPAGWRVDPDGDDVLPSGRWAHGAPMRSVAFDYSLQPGAAYSGTGAFVTGLSSADTDNVDGRTTLESPPFGIKDLRQPFLSYQVYFVAANFQAELLVPSDGELRVQASADGTSWVEVDRVTGMATGWQRRLIRLSEALGPGVSARSEVRFRFVAAQTTTGANPVVEAVIDDVGIYEESPGCDPAAPVSPEVLPPTEDAGCACDVGRAPRPPAGGLAMLLLGFAMLVRRARRRP
jgi:MYXO-CTERM domain-containing protein